MTISELLKLPHCPLRLSYGDTRLYYDDGATEWVVMHQGYRKRRPTELIRTGSEEEAVAAFVRAAGIDVDSVKF